ncbi:hypothetical protein BKA70DRAFT_1220346 [Coprinopsis sp. MPI-PUGE-AT-0042]|nr:hypothetical protein BKA70DRAFT_1220346 [Coprinopsis sp. MPI-PUGE-AT-0042]
MSSTSSSTGLPPKLGKPSVHPPPPPSATLKICRQCTSSRMGPVNVCDVRGCIRPQNYGRYHQVCFDCQDVAWLSPETSVDQVPEPVQMYLAVLNSTSVAGGADANVKLDCGNPGWDGCRVHLLPSYSAAPSSSQPPATPAPPPSHPPAVSSSHVPVSPMSSSMATPTTNRVAGFVSTTPAPNIPGALGAVGHTPALAATHGSQGSTSTLPAVHSGYSTSFNEDWGSQVAEYMKKMEENALREEKRAQEEELSAAVERDFSNVIDIFLWTRAGQGPRRFKVVTRHQTSQHSESVMFVPEHHPALCRLIEPLDDGISVMVELFPVKVWTTQSVHVPICIHRGDQVFMRLAGLEDKDCIDLETHIRFTIDFAGNGNTTLRKLKHVAPSQPVSDAAIRSAVQALQDNPSSSSTPGSQTAGGAVIAADTFLSVPNRLVSTIPWPLTYVCDMKSGMEELASAKGALLSVSFSQAFPSSVFTVSTVYKHRSVFAQAKEAGLLERYVAYGRTPEGRWSQMVKEVSQLPPPPGPPSQAAPAPSPPSTQPLLTVPSSAQRLSVPGLDDDDDEDFDLYEARIEVLSFHPVAGTTRDTVGSSTDGVWRSCYLNQSKPIKRGHMKIVREAVASRASLFDSHFAIKFISLPGVWWESTGAPNETYAIFVEAGRLFRLHSNWNTFSSAVEQLGVAVHDISTLSIDLVNFKTSGSRDWIGLAQPHIRGHVMSPSEMEGSLRLAEILDAFTHFSYTWNDSDLLHCDFEALYSHPLCSNQKRRQHIQLLL